MANVVKNLNEVKRPFEGMTVLVMNELTTYKFENDKWNRKKRTDNIKNMINKVTPVLQ